MEIPLGVLRWRTHAQMRHKTLGSGRGLGKRITDGEARQRLLEVESRNLGVLNVVAGSCKEVQVDRGQAMEAWQISNKAVEGRHPNRQDPV